MQQSPEAKLEETLQIVQQLTMWSLMASKQVKQVELKLRQADRAHQK